MIRVDGTRLKDETGRTVILRGVNLGGSSKVPFRPNGATHIREGFYDHRRVSFVGRPFPLAEADEHFSRLRAWGMTFLRLLVTWEAIEHAGPGIYDEAYLDYVVQIVRKAGEYGIDLFIDPHQDVWGRMSGGDGAPGWTFEVIGMDVTRFADTGAAIVHAVHGDPFPRMIWPTNYTKLATATMFTLFFGGDDFAPRTTIDGEPVQGFLQRHYVGAIRQLAERLKDLPNVVGYDTMNEPSAGFIGWTDLESAEGGLRLGLSPTPLQAILLGAGFPQEVDVWKLGLLGFRRSGRRVINPHGVRVWREGTEGVWLENGVWELASDGTPRLVRPNHFSRVRGREVDFANDYLRPFAVRYTREIRSVHPGAIIFVEGPPGRRPPRWGPDAPSQVVHAAHWYDGATLFIKRYYPFLGFDFLSNRLVFGPRRVRRSFTRQLASIKAESEDEMGGLPTLIGEFGIPFDMHDGRAYRTGDFSRQIRALDASFRPIEENLLSCTLWNYTADNDNRRGDQWNGEDLSIFSRDQQAHPGHIHSGGRALEAAVRPYARRVPGEPLEMTFDVRGRVFEFAFRHDPTIEAPTEIFVPRYQYPNGCRVEISDGEFALDWDKQILTYAHGRERSDHRVRILPPGDR
jgi:hypothetical protein